jgi:hypothetical protein
MGHDSRAVALDEMEPGLDERKASNIADLMRTSASGAIGRRGSAGGTASEFQMRSAFLFSAINNPLHTAADLSRVAVLRMLPFDKDSEKGEPINAETTGPMILAQMMRAWGDGGHGFKMQYDRFAAALAEGGHEKRGQDTYGTLLACAAMLLGDELAAELGVPLGPGGGARMVASRLSGGRQPAGSRGQQAELSAMRRPHPDQRGEGLAQFVAQHHRPGHLRPAHHQRGRRRDRAADRPQHRQARHQHRRLRAVQHPRDRRRRDAQPGPVARGRADQIRAAQAGWVLAVPHQSSKVAELLEGTDWQRGGWRDAFQQCTTPGVMIRTDPINKVTIDGVQVRCTLIVLDRYHAAPER